MTNFHLQDLTINRTLVTPSPRYAPYLPTCIAYNLGNQINIGGTVSKYSVSTSCTASFGSNTVQVRVTGSE